MASYCTSFFINLAMYLIVHGESIDTDTDETII